MEDQVDLEPPPDFIPPMDQEVDSLRVPPHSVEAEQSVLGGIMLDNSAWDAVADQLTEEDFYRREHRLIFRAVADLAAKAQPFDAITISDWLTANNLLDQAGDLAYIGRLASDTPSAAAVSAYAEIVRQRSVRRSLIAVGGDISNSAFNTEGRDTRELLDEAERKVFEIADQGSRGSTGFVGIKVLLGKAIDRIDELFQRDEPITGLPTGYTDFDEMTSGLQPSDLIIVAGRPSMGKCVQADTEILLEDGSVETIETIYRQKKARLLSLDGRLKLALTEPSHFVDDGEKPVFRVTTRLGRVIETTASHPYLTPQGWQPLAQLRERQRIAVPRVLPVFGSEAMPECKVKLLAYLLGDGARTQTSATFTHANPRIQADFIAAVEAFGGVRATLRCGEDRAQEITTAADLGWIAARRRQFALRLRQWLDNSPRCDRQFAFAVGFSPTSDDHWTQGRRVPGETLFGKIGDFFSIQGSGWLPEGRDSAAKKAPNAVTRWLDELGVWGKDAQHTALPDGVFRLPKEQLGIFINRLFATDGWASLLANGQAQLGFSALSERRGRQLQHLLLRFGIIATVRSRTVKLDGRLTPAWQLDITDAAAIRLFASEIGIYGQEQALSRVLEAVAGKRGQTSGDLRGLSDLAGSDVYWDEIIEIRPVGTKQVYDLTIPETHNFIANDICVHNTTFAVNIAESAAIKVKQPVAIFSMEMPAEQLAMRMMASLGRIDSHRMRTGKLLDEDWPRITSAVSILSEAQLFIDDTPALTPTELRARCRRLVREHGDLGLIVIDYLQLMQGSTKSDNRTNEISEISRSLKALAKELHVPVICLSQLNRSLEQRPNKRPIMSDLRESGAIEQDADVIVFIYRDEVYNEDSTEKGTAEIIIGKQRNGPIGTVRLTFIGQFTRFENYTPPAFAEEEFE